MIAFHLPPSTTSSGHLRPLGFAKYLPRFGWGPVALSACERVYTQVDPASVALIPEGCPVYRTFALDARRHLSIRGKYPAILAQPDRWASWWPTAVYHGLRIIRRHKVRAIWSTYPIMTAHCIAGTLSRLTGLPWIADFRDPVASPVAAHDKMTVSTRMRCERRILSRAAYSVFTTPGAMRSYAERYPKTYDEGRLKLIPNGFDDDDFAALEANKACPSRRPLHLVHGGVLYPSGRNPVPFFNALARLKDSGRLSAQEVRVTLRASGSERQYGTELHRLGLDDMVSLAPSVSYHAALAEQAQANALLLFQGSQFDQQIPAKVYEYLRIGRPIFALVGERGDTAALLRKTGGAHLVTSDSVPEIERNLMEFVHNVRSGQAPESDPKVAACYSRQSGARSLARLLDDTMDVNPTKN
ncbi:MAG: glycosyltransferase [Rhodanobacteraceae bacterium]